MILKKKMLNTKKQDGKIQINFWLLFVTAMVLSEKSFTICVRFCCNGRILLGHVGCCDQVGGLVPARPHPGLGWRAHQVVEVDHELRAQLAHREHVQAPAGFIRTEHI